MNLTLADLPLILDSIHNEEDLIRVFFGCKALRKILSIGDEAIVREVCQYSESIGTRLIQLLTLMYSDEELQIEILWALVNLTSLMSRHKAKKLIEQGLFNSILQSLQLLSTQSSLVHLVQKSELAFILVQNLIDESDDLKLYLLNVFISEGNNQRFCFLNAIDKIMDAIENSYQPYGID